MQEKYVQEKINFPEINKQFRQFLLELFVTKHISIHISNAINLRSLFFRQFCKQNIF